jgi:tyrosyl-tRNA synthetase
MKPPREQLKDLLRGAVNVHTEEELLKKLEKGTPLRVKLGVDPSSPDIHLGHTVVLRKLRQFQDAGHTAVLIIGDFTALVGDPTGKKKTRPQLTPQEVEANAKTYTDQAFLILDREKTEVAFNSKWLLPLGADGMIKLAAHYTVARMLERDDFGKRYQSGQPIAIHEFLYPLAQAYDSVAIEADIELGGTDQLFNLLAGRELMEKLGMEPQVCLTLPLLEGTDGVQKMSKSYGNYIGLTDAPDDMFGKVMSVPDALMPRYYRLATAVSVSDVDSIERKLADGSLHPNEAKRRLAREIVTLYHDESHAVAAEEAFDRVFKQHELPEDIPEFKVELADDVYLPGLLQEIGLVATSSEGRRMIDGGAVRVNGEALEPRVYECPRARIQGSVLQVGKRRYARLTA